MSFDMETDLSKLKLDQAILHVYNKLTVPVDICWQSSECFQCNDISQGTLEAGDNTSIILTSRYSNQINVKTVTGHGNTSLYCETIHRFRDHGVYSLTVSTKETCKFKTIDSGRDILTPIWITSASYILLVLILLGLHYVWRRYKNSGNDSGNFNILSPSSRNSLPRNIDPNESATTPSLDNNDVHEPHYSNVDDEDEEQKRSTALSVEQTESELRTIPKKKRIMSLDAFRGLVILLMIFVNSGGGGYSFFQHVPWYGLTLADVIFPSFIMVMGFSISLSIRSRLMQNKDFLLIGYKILRRTFKLFMLGFILNTNYTDLGHVRVMGVLQRFAISYLVVATLHLTSVYRGNKFLTREQSLTVREVIMVFLPEILSHSFLLGIYLYFTLKFKYDDNCPPGYQGPGGLERHGELLNCTGGAAGYIDRLILGDNHMYHGSTARPIYKHSMKIDPEGILGITTSIILTEFGLISGRIMLKAKTHYTRILRWFMFSCAAGILTIFLTLLGDSNSQGFIPVVKNLWSLSFVSATAGIALLTFTVFYLLIDTTETWKNGFPFHFAGANPILLYISASIFGGYLPFWYSVDESSHAWLLVRSCTTTTLWLLIAIYLYKKKIFMTL